MADPLAVLVDDPVNDTVHHPYSAYNQGWDAAEAGWHRLANPYLAVRERAWWDMGWRDFHGEFDGKEGGG